MIHKTGLVAIGEPTIPLAEAVKPKPMSGAQMLAYYTPSKIMLLSSAFQMVENKTNWKLPIENAEIPKSMVEITVEAIEFYGLGTAIVESTAFGSETVLISAPGYYEATGA